MLLFNSKALLRRDATQSAVMRLHVVCPSVTFRYHDHISRGVYPKGGWESNLPRFLKWGVEELVNSNNFLCLDRHTVA